jgi:hypothetical protein
MSLLLSNLVSQCFFLFNLDICLLEEQTPSRLVLVAFFTIFIEFFLLSEIRNLCIVLFSSSAE